MASFARGVRQFNDESSIDFLRRIAESKRAGSIYGLEELGKFDSPKAHEALLALSSFRRDEWYFRTLVRTDNSRCVEKALQFADEEQRDIYWIVDAIDSCIDSARNIYSHDLELKQFDSETLCDELTALSNWASFPPTSR